MSAIDVSVVVPTHNGGCRLPATLAHIAAQRPPPGLEWEVLVVDNGSTDDTAQAARGAWPAGAQAPLRITREPRLGLTYARERGFTESRGRLISWVEDDNWIAPDWLERVIRLMAAHPRVGACGGFNEAVCEVEPPPWFHTYASWYATGAQGDRGGDVTSSRGFLWGAGLSVRREAWEHLSDNGFTPLLSDRQGGRGLRSGGDSELCFALRLSGWRLWFEPRMRLRHFLFAGRLRWEYLRRLWRGVGASTVGFDPYLSALEGAGPPGRAAWAGEARRALARVARRPALAGRATREPLEGELGVLELERDLGRLGELLRRRGGYDRSFHSVSSARWRREP